MPDGLRRIDNRGHTILAGERAHFLGGIDRAEGVGDVGEAQESNPAAAQFALQLREVEQAPVPIDGEVVELRAVTLRGNLPRHHVAVMLHLCQENRVAGFEKSAAPAVGNQVNALGRAACENDFLVAGGMNEFGHLGPGGLKGRCRPVAELMNPAMHVAVVPQIKIAHRLNDRHRFLARGGIVEIHQRLPIDPLIQNGKIRADFQHVDFGGKIIHTLSGTIPVGQRNQRFVHIRVDFSNTAAQNSFVFMNGFGRTDAGNGQIAFATCDPAHTFHLCDVFTEMTFEFNDIRFDQHSF